MAYQDNFIDVHCHILPGLDDGAKDIEQTKEMFMTAYEEGIRTIIVTPHNYASRRSASAQTIIETLRQMEVFRQYSTNILNVLNSNK